MVPATDAEAWIREAAVEPERQSPEEEPRGWRSLTEPERQRDEAKPEEWSPEVQDGRHQTKAEPEGRGSRAELVDCRATVERRELGPMVEPTGQRAEGLGGWRGSRGKLRPPRRWRMAVPPSSHRIDGRLRASRGAARWQRWRRQERVGGREFSRSGNWMPLLRSGHWRIWSPLRAGQGNQGRRRAGRNKRGQWREEREQFNLQSSIPVYQIPRHV